MASSDETDGSKQLEDQGLCPESAGEAPHYNTAKHSPAANKYSKKSSKIVANINIQCIKFMTRRILYALHVSVLPAFITEWGLPLISL